MTTAKQVYLKDFNDNQPDRLLETLEIDLTPEQRIYLKQNKEEPRTLLLKKFNLRFGTQHTKIQLTRAIEVMDAPKVKPTGILSPNRHKNVYYKPRDGTWEARINFNKVRTILYRGSELEAIEAVRDFKKLHGIK